MARIVLIVPRWVGLRRAEKYWTNLNGAKTVCDSYNGRTRKREEYHVKDGGTRLKRI